MGFAWSTAIKDWQRLRRDPIGVVMWVGIPLLIGGLITLASGGTEGPSPQAHVLIVDHDESFLSGLLVGALGSDAAGVMNTTAVEEVEGRAQIEKGEASALLVIPKGFGRAVLLEEPTVLELVTNPSEQILPRIVEESLSMLVDAVFYLHRLFGEELRQIASGPATGSNTLSDAFIARLSVRIKHAVDRLSDYLAPPIVQVSVTTPDAEQADEYPRGIAILFLPGILFMSLLFMAQGLSADIWDEREKRTLRRVVCSPQSTVSFLAGKLIGGAGLVTLVSAIALLVGFAYFRLDVVWLPVAMGWCVVSGLGLILMMLVIQLHAPSQRSGGILTMVVLFPLMMAGGSFFPFEAMPSWMAAIGRLTPNGWALEQLKRILLEDVSSGSLLVTLAGLLVVGAVLFLWCARRLRSGFAQA